MVSLRARVAINGPLTAVRPGDPARSESQAQAAPPRLTLGIDQRASVSRGGCLPSRRAALTPLAVQRGISSAGIGLLLIP